MIHRNTNITITVKENRTEIADYRSIIFERPVGFVYEPGDWVDLAFDQHELKGGKTYSLSSSPTEPDLMITFKDGISEIKRHLAGILPGDKLIIIQYGNDYKFAFKSYQAGILIAGGVGIAPFRSMIKEMIDKKTSNQVRLVYMNKSIDFLFETELNYMANQMPQVTIVKIVTGELNKKSRTTILVNAISDFDSLFYIAGPEAMVEDTEALLIHYGVDLKDIKVDSFGGY